VAEKAATDPVVTTGEIRDFKAPLKPLLPSENCLTRESQTGILFNFAEYLALVDWSGRIIRNDKRGHIDSALPPFFARLRVSSDQWRINTTQFEAIQRARFNRITPQLDTG